MPSTVCAGVGRRRPSHLSALGWHLGLRARKRVHLRPHVPDRDHKRRQLQPKGKAGPGRAFEAATDAARDGERAIGASLVGESRQPARCTTVSCSLRPPFETPGGSEQSPQGAESGMRLHATSPLISWPISRGVKLVLRDSRPLSWRLCAVDRMSARMRRRDCTVCNSLRQPADQP